VPKGKRLPWKGMVMVVSVCYCGTTDRLAFRPSDVAVGRLPLRDSATSSKASTEKSERASGCTVMPDTFSQRSASSTAGYQPHRRCLLPPPIVLPYQGEHY
jgi:hypothetical protein